MTTLLFIDDPGALPETNSDETVVTVSETVYDSSPADRHCVLATECLADNQEIVDSDDYALMRSWLSGHASHDGIDLGPLLQSQFIYLYATSLYRQFRAIRTVIEEESPEHVKVRTRKRLPYEWLEVGSENLYTPIFECLADEYDFTLSMTETGIVEHINNGLFDIFGPLTLRSLENITESITRIRERTSGADADVLVFLNNTNNLNSLLPVWRELQHRGVEVTIVYHVFGVTNIDISPLKTLRDTGVTVRTFESYITRSAYKTARVRNQDFGHRWRTIRDDEAFHNRFKLDGVSIWKALKERFKLHYQFHYQRLVRFIEGGRNLIDIIEPSVTLFKGVGPKSTRTFATVANEADVPTVMVQHGKSNPLQRFEPIVDHIAAWGELSKEFYMTQGYDAEQINICGSPKFDHLHDFDIDKERLRLTLDIEDDLDVLMLVSQPHNNDVRRNVATTICNSIESMSGVVLLIRPHPREDETLLRNVVKQHDVKTAFAPDQDIHRLVEFADAVIGVNTTVLFEASLMDTPAIVLNFTEERILDFWHQEGFTIIDDAADIPGVVRQILREKSYRESVLSSQPSMGIRYAHNEDGMATERIVDLITSI